MDTRSNDLCIAYNLSHVAEARAHVERGGRVVCIDFLLERECKKQGIPYISLREVLDTEDGEVEWWKLGHDVSREWYRLPEMSFLAYHGIRLAEAPEPVYEAHFARLFYYARIYTALKTKFPEDTFQLPPPADITHGPEFLAALQPWAPIDAARLVRLPTRSLPTRAAPSEYPFPRMTIKWLVLQVYNALMSLVPRRGLKIYSSEYWTHPLSVVPYLEDTELVLLESRNLFGIPWKIRLKHRIRVKRPHSVISTGEQRRAREITAGYMNSWESAKEAVATHLHAERSEFDWSPALEAFTDLVRYTPRIVADIRTLEDVMRSERPNLVLQTASVGGPEHYFFLMAKVAKALSIPSVELQHAGATVDPRSVFHRIETDYLLTYGRDVNEWHERIGSPADKLIAVGSPRFDTYVHNGEAGARGREETLTQLGLDPSRPVLLAVVPFSATYISAVDSYQLADFYSTLRLVQQNTPGLQVLCKVRNNAGVTVLKEYLEEVFEGDYAVSGAADIFPLLYASDAVMCGNSTVIYQVLLAQKPLVLYPWRQYDSYHAQVYGRAAPLFHTAPGAVAAATRIFKDTAFRDELMATQKKFLEGYSFDGHSSERAAKLLRTLAKPKGA